MINSNNLDIYKLFLENIPYPIWIQDIDTKIIFINEYYEYLYDIKASEAIGKKTVDIVPNDIAVSYNQQLERTISSKKITVSDAKIKGLYYRAYVFPLLDDNKCVRGVAGIVIDINEEKKQHIELIQQKNILRTIMDALPESIFYKDENSKYIGYNKSFRDNFNRLNKCCLLGKTDMDLLDDKERASNFHKQDKEIIKSKTPVSFEYSYENDEGCTIIEESLKTPIIDNHGNVSGIVGISRDITKQKTLEEKLRQLGEIDVLTNLYNRNCFEDKIKELHDEKYYPLGIIMGDVNGLKLINDTLGHLEGDKLLKSISYVLKSSCKESEYIFRWGGDEFIILVPNADEYKCDSIITRILNDCKKYDYEYMQLSISLGAVVKKDLNDNFHSYIKKVDEKVYRHKLLENKSIKSSIMYSLLNSLEEKNVETKEHAQRVSQYSLALGKILNLTRSQLDELEIVASLHDIGKIGISEDILQKPASLTSEEFEILKTHPEKGYRIINASSELDSVAKGVLTHHERYDGNGYPMGLKGDEIPLISRIINIADSFDVMTSTRPYKKAMCKKDAIQELLKCSGTQFDPNLVQPFIGYIKNIEI